MKSKFIFSIFVLMLGALTHASSSFQLEGTRADKVFDKLQKVNILSYEGHAMGKNYYKVNDVQCIYEAGVQELECNNTKLSHSKEAKLDLKQMNQLSLIKYDGGSNDGKGYFVTKAQYCYTTHLEGKNIEDSSILHCY